VNCPFCHVSGVIVLQVYRMFQESWWKEAKVDRIAPDLLSCWFVKWFLTVVALVVLQLHVLETDLCLLLGVQLCVVSREIH
jgi:hypothetical protein